MAWCEWATIAWCEWATIIWHEWAKHLASVYTKGQSTSPLRQFCDDSSDSVLIENNGVNGE